MDQQMEKTISNLRANHFQVFYCSDLVKAREQVYQMVSVGDEVGLGGSMTVGALGLSDLLADKSIIFLDHHKPSLSPEEVLEVRRKQLVCDVFFSGSNAVTEDGKLLNVDGIGNRVAAMMFGPKKVIVVVGKNKIVPNIHFAMQRVQQVAAPLNNKRLKTGNPCVESGQCMNCQGDNRICNVISIMDKKPKLTDFNIVIIDEVLGY